MHLALEMPSGRSDASGMKISGPTGPTTVWH